MTENELRIKGMEILRSRLGLVDSARFISILLREPFDYTEWRQTAFDGESLNDLYSKSADAWFAKEADKNPGAL